MLTPPPVFRALRPGISIARPQEPARSAGRAATCPPSRALAASAERVPEAATPPIMSAIPTKYRRRPISILSYAYTVKWLTREHPARLTRGVAKDQGRTGRALIHLVLRGRGLATRVLPPISLVLPTWAKDYIDGLQATRYRGPASASAAQEGINRWIARFAAACLRAVADTSDFEKRSRLLQQEWRAKLGPVRANSATDLLLRALPGAPLITVSSAAALIGRTFAPANEAVRRLVDAEILSPVKVGRRNRAFEATAVIEAFTALERQLASPLGNTLTSEPSRPVPCRPPAINAGM
jgi:hypothetical protein